MVAAAQKAEKQLETLSCKNLKLVLAEHNVGFEGVVEKEELIRLARHALTVSQASFTATSVACTASSLQQIGCSCFTMFYDGFTIPQMSMM